MTESLENADVKDKILRRWGKEKPPVRKFVLWGWDHNNNPSFLILFGIHEFKRKQISITKDEIEEYLKDYDLELKPEIRPGDYNQLKDTVSYLGYTILKGNEGHFPPFIDLKLRSFREYGGRDSSYRSRRSSYYRSEPTKRVYYLADQKGSYNFIKSKRRWNASIKLKEAAPYLDFPEHQKIDLPYFENIDYKRYLKKIKAVVHSFDNFVIADDPSNVFELDGKLKKFEDKLLKLFSSQNLFQRKKALSDLIDMNPPKELYLKMLDIGSIDVLSGLFLELAKRANPILADEAEILNDSNIAWALINQVTGLKRCISLYLTSINSNLKKKKIKEIYGIIPELDLEAISVERPYLTSRRDRRLSRMLKRYKQGTDFDDYVNEWSPLEWHFLGSGLKFKPNIITNGNKVYSTRIKNIIQEAEIYNLPDIIGWIGALLDSVKIYYLTVKQRGFLIYIRRYIRRILLNYLRNDEKAFVNALKSFFTHYKQYFISQPYSRYGSRSEINKINSLLDYFLHGHIRDLSKDSYSSYYYSRSRRPNLEGVNFKYKRMRDHFNQIEEIWNNHIDDVIEIAKISEVDDILNFFIKYLRENLDYVFKIIPPQDLVSLSLSRNYGLRKLFRNRLDEIVEKSVIFDPELMLALMGSNDLELQELSWRYFDKTKGKFTPDMISGLLILENLDYWTEFIIEGLNELENKEYYTFYINMLNQAQHFSEKRVEISEILEDSLNRLAENINFLNDREKYEIINVVLDIIRHEQNTTDWYVSYIQNLIFSLPYKELKSIIKEMEMDFDQRLSNDHSNSILYLLKNLIKDQIPPEHEIVDILAFGAAKTIHTFVNLVEENKDQLKTSQSKLLILFESDVAALNAIAANVFETLDKNFERVLSILIDSPETRVQSYAINVMKMKYDDKIPENFLIQMLEHGSPIIKTFISDKIERIIGNFGNGDADLFIYYIRTLLFYPNYGSKSKDRIFHLLPEFIKQNKEKKADVEAILLELGGSNVIKDSERALVSLALIKKEGF